jgi:hypothetical protein
MMDGKINWSIVYREGYKLAFGDGARGFVEVRWDDQDPNNLGYAYHDTYDSGELGGDTLAEAMYNYEYMTRNS